MDKRFNIHDWQAKQRLVENDFKRLRHPEEFKFLDGLKADNKINRWGITSLQTRFGLSDEKAIEIFNLYTSSLRDRALPTRGEDMNESLNPEVSRNVDKFIRAMADRYDYTMQDAVYAIMAALKQRNYDGLEEKEGVKHYTKDGKEWTGATHKMPNGKLMTQNPHNEDSEELFHKEDLDEHHNDKNFPGKDLSAWDLLDKIKDSNEDLYNKVEAFMKSMKEMNTTGAVGAFLTPNAFKKKKKK